ncbi:syntaxin-5-like [Mercenaria mercenaria]|uniref:syntaxin-5-like n=1 Tax=Mercenaria mercenaria TaxID=6596 RepID=UPI001E1D6387|nr:syntaxin-5-like [Mercenaria mercenaria]
MITRRRRNNSDSDDRPITNRYQLGGKTFETQEPAASEFPSSFIDSEMSCRDRTNEFASAVKSLQSRHINGHLPSSRRTGPIKQRSEFTQIAKRIGRDLANTFAKLEKLTLLAKRKSLFDDKPVEIQELTYIIKEDINSLNKQIAQLQQVARGQQGQNARQKQTHSNTVVVALQSKLATMSNDFKQVLEVRTENLKHQKSRREQFSQATSMSPASPQGFGNPGQSVLLQDEAKYNGQAGGDFAINMDLDKSRYQQQLQLIDEQDSYISERANTMQNIESTIVELGQIFTQLAHMVKEQEESVQRIDSNVEDAQLNVEAAHGELLKYFQSVTNNRWLMIKIFAVLIIFFIIFIVFMA